MTNYIVRLTAELTDLFIYAGIEIWIVLIALNLPPNVQFFKGFAKKVLSALEAAPQPTLQTASGVQQHGASNEVLILGRLAKSGSESSGD